MKKFSVFLVFGIFLSLFIKADELPDPDGKEADMSKPVQVYILLGQSNMLGFGKTSTLKDVCQNKKLYPYLIDDSGNWTKRKDVRNVRIMCSGNSPAKTLINDWMTISGRTIGPEVGIGHYLGNAIKGPVLILKSCIGNRSLGWDLLPPGSKQYKYEGQIQAGYGEAAGGIPKEQAPGKWYAGCQYDGDIGGAKKVLENLSKYYPGAKNYEVAGFFWWQGDKDFRNNAHSEKYEENLMNLIKALRKDFNSPKARFVCASLGQTKEGSGGNQGKILNAMKNVDGNSGKYPENKGLVAWVYSHPLSKGSSSSAHYGGNPETYMNVGEAMGKAMVGILKKPMTDAEFKKNLDKYSMPVYASISRKKYSFAHKALSALKTHLETLEKNGSMDDEQFDKKISVYDILDSKYKNGVAELIRPIVESREIKDYYQLSLAYKNAKNYLKGIPEFDEASKDIEDELKSKEVRKEISNGKKFYSFIKSCIKSEARSKEERSERKAQSYKKALEKMAEKFKDSVYANAAKKAAEEISDPKTKFQEPSYYLK